MTATVQHKPSEREGGQNVRSINAYDRAAAQGGQNASPVDRGAEEKSFFALALQADGRYGGNKRGAA